MPTVKLQPPADMPRASMARAGARRPVTTVTGTGSTRTRPAAAPDDAAQVGSVTDTSACDCDAVDITPPPPLVADPAVTRAPVNGAAAGVNGGASSAQASSVLANMTLDGMAQARILRRGADTGRLTHIHRIPARRGRRA